MVAKEPLAICRETLWQIDSEVNFPIFLAFNQVLPSVMPAQAGI
jgi:hypothetical protein